MLATSPFSDALQSGKAKNIEINETLNKLVDLMKDVHGGDWLVNLDHERRTIFAFQR